MNYKMKTAELKLQARTKLKGHFTGLALMTLVYMIILTICELIPSFCFSDTSKMMFFIMYMIASFLLEVIGSMFAIGISRGALCSVRGEEFTFSDILYAFKNSSTPFLEAQMIISDISILLQLPIIYLDYIYDFGLIIYYALVYSVALIATLLTLHLRFIVYVIIDNPDYTIKEALAETISITKGNYIRILKLAISFIPLYILGVVTLMIGYLFAMPYADAARAVLYEEIK